MTGYDFVHRDAWCRDGQRRVADLLGCSLVWSVWVLASLALFLYIGHYARNIPFHDDWRLVPVVTGHEPISLKWAWSQHAEHRLLVSRLILASLMRWVIPDFRAGMYLSAGLLSVAAALMITLARRLRGCQGLADTLLPLSILNLAQSESVLIGFALNLVLTSWLAFWLIFVLGGATDRPAWKTVVLTGLALVILPLCGGSGLVMLPPLVLWLAIYLCWGAGPGPAPDGHARSFGFLALMICAAIAALYFKDYVRMRPPVPSLGAVARTSLECFSLCLAPRSAGFGEAAAATVVVMVIATLARLTAVAVKSPQERSRAMGLAAVILSLLLVVVSVGVGSSGFGPRSGLLSRYITLVAPLLSALYVSCLLYSPVRRRQAIHGFLLVVVCLCVPGSIRAGREEAEPRLGCFHQVEDCLKTGGSDSQVLDLACPTLISDRELASVWLRDLRSSRFGDFKPLEEARERAPMATVFDQGARRR